MFCFCKDNNQFYKRDIILLNEFNKQNKGYEQQMLELEKVIN
jgi:hypothetical protein